MRRALERALVVAVVALAVPSASIARPAQGESEAAPTFERDRSWPKPLPDNWRLGIVWAVSFDSRDHVWVLHAAEQYLVDIGDGYLNERVIVFDGDSGEYVRHWGRYGEPPDDAFEAGERSPRYAHAAQLSNDGLLYVSDREHGSIHVHRRDGSFVTEMPLPVKVNSVAFSADPGQHYLYAGGMRTGANGRYDLSAEGRIVILRSSDLQVLGSFESAGQHFFDVDSRGNI